MVVDWYGRMSVELLERELIDSTFRVTDDGSHDKFTHIVVEGWWPKDEEGNRTGEFFPDTPVVDGTVFGTPVRAICGKIWVPGDNVDKYKLCPTCEGLAKERGWQIPKV